MRSCVGEYDVLCFDDLVGTIYGAYLGQAQLSAGLSSALLFSDSGGYRSRARFISATH